MIEKYVVSLELAKRMKELGWKQGKSYFIWLFDDSTNDWHLYPRYEFVDKKDILDFMLLTRDAPLFAEIWEELSYTLIDKDSLIINYKRVEGDNAVGYKNDGEDFILINVFKFNFIQENAGEMWCWLKENGYIKEVE